jgi:iron complex transport system ATP-binding protein
VSAGSTALALEQISFSYRRVPIFAALDLTVATGTITGILGPNGSGKTTLVRLGSGAIRPSAGRIALFGIDITSMPARERARNVAIVPQETHPVFEFTVEEIVRMGRAPHLGLLGLERPLDRKIASEAMERCEVQDLAARSFRALSGGERQRVMLARALAQQARLLLLDEPTAFLDLKHRLSVYALLSRLHQDHGLTVVVVSHDINLAARFCDRLVLLRRGSIAADGSPNEVLRPDPIRSVYEVDVEVRTDPSSGRPFVIPLAPSTGSHARS